MPSLLKSRWFSIGPRSSGGIKDISEERTRLVWPQRQADE
jgi:hypothetical protein